MEPPTEAYTKNRQAGYVKRLFSQAEASLSPISAEQAEPDVAPLGAGDVCITFLLNAKSHPVVAKVFLPTDDCITNYGYDLLHTQFDKEAELLTTIQHPYIAKGFATTEIPLTSSRVAPVLVREYLPYTFEQSIKNMPPETRLVECERMTRNISAALEYLREEQHTLLLDLDGSNIGRRTEGEYVITDLGMTIDADTHMGIVGITHHTAPEIRHARYDTTQQQEHASTQAQVFSLASIVYETMGGVMPQKLGSVFGGEYDVTTLSSAVLPATREVLEKALSHDPESRFATPVEFSRAFSRSFIAS